MPAALLAAATLAIESERKKVDASRTVQKLRSRSLKRMFGYPAGLDLQDIDDMDQD